MTRLTIPRAGRPVKTLVSGGVAGVLAVSAAGDGAGGRLGAEQVGRPDLHAGRAQRQGCRDALASAMPPAAMTGTFTACTICGTSASVPTWVVRSSDRNMPRWPPASSPWAMIASTPRASSQRASSTVVAEESTFAPQRPHPREQVGRRQAEVEAHHGGPELVEHVGGLVAERRAARPRR